MEAPMHPAQLRTQAGKKALDAWDMSTEREHLVFFFLMLGHILCDYVVLAVVQRKSHAGSLKTIMDLTICVGQYIHKKPLALNQNEEQLSKSIKRSPTWWTSNMWVLIQWAL